VVTSATVHTDNGFLTRTQLRVICSQLEENASLGSSPDQDLFQSAVKLLERRERFVCF